MDEDDYALDTEKLLLYNMKESNEANHMPPLTVNLSNASNKGLTDQYLKVHRRYAKAHNLVKSIEPIKVSTTDLSRTAFRLRKVWLDVMKKCIRSYRVNIIPEFLISVHRGMVQVI